MPRDRALLHLSKLDDFAAWMAKSGWVREPTKGTYEVLRLAKAGETPLIFFSRANAREHVTVQAGPQHRFVRAYLRERN